MKKLLLFILIPFLGIAQQFTDSGINYNITSATPPFAVEVIANTPNYSGNISIPISVDYLSNTYAVTAIGISAFNGCSGLTSVTIPNSVTTIGDYAFYFCSGLTSVTIPNSVTTIGNYAFNYCSGLTSINISNSVTTIGDGAFDSSGLTSINIPNSVTTMGGYVFSRCYNLTSATLSNSLTTISSGTFSSCYILTSVIIPNSVTTIGDSAFHGCEILPSIDIPNSVNIIGNYAFFQCLSLTSVIIPSSVTSIGGDAFTFCYALNSVTIPSSVTSIGDYAFSGCSVLNTVNCYIATPLVINANVFQSVNQAACILNVPIGTQAAYGAAAVWQNFAPINGVLATSSFVKNSFSMYPNPSNGFVTIALENNLQIEKVNFYNSLGQLIKTTTVNIISTSELAKGSYFVEVVTNEGKASKRLLVQ
jgi:hypothetical protein